MHFKNKTIWLTGASSGIGEALVYELDKKEARVIISSRQKDLLNLVRAKCRNPQNIFVYPLDLAELYLLPEKAKEVTEKFGRVDILINNAGIGQRSLAKDTGIEVDKKIMDINYFGTISLTKALLPLMIKERSGHLVVISSIAGKFGSPYRSAYCASKHALQGFFDSLRAEVSKYNIKTTVISPGFIKTNIAAKALTGTGGEFGKASEIPRGFGMTAEECAVSILNAIENEKEDAVIGGPETGSVLIKRFFPGILSMVLKKIRTI